MNKMKLEPSKLIIGVVLLLAILIATTNVSHISGAASVTATNCVPVTLTAGQSKIVHGQTVHLTDVICAGEVSLKINELTVIATIVNTPTIEGISLEVVDTRFTPKIENRVANLMICESTYTTYSY